MAIQFDNNLLELLPPPAQGGLSFGIKNGASGTTSLVGDQDDTYTRDDLYENAQTGQVTINFDGKSGIDSIFLTEPATSRVLKGRLTSSTATVPTATWSLQSSFATGQSTINGTNIEWVGTTGNWSSLYLASLYLQLNKITTEVSFALDPTNTTNALSLAGRAITETETRSTFGAANDIFYAIDKSNHTYLMGDGNDLVSSYDSGNNFDGGQGLDTYVLAGMGQWEFTTAPTSFAASYNVNAQGQVEIDISGDSISSYRAANLIGFEALVFADRKVRLATAAKTGSTVQGIVGEYTVILGDAAADTLIGVTAGDTLKGGGGNDFIAAGNGAIGANLLKNGSFEINNARNRRWTYLPQLEGWTSLVGTPTNFSAGGTFEIWKNFSAVRATDGQSILELDSNASVNGIEQKIQTQANQTYLLTFDYAARLDAAGPSRPKSRNGDTFAIYWNNTKVGDFASSTKKWATLTATVTGSGGLDALRFFEATSQNDQYGILLDNVKLQAYAPSSDLSVNVLDGGAGRDTLVGSIVVDRFVFEAGDSGNSLSTADVIRQFTSGVDVVDISELTAGSAISFVSAFTGSSGNAELITQTQTLAGKQGLLASLDLDGNATADFAIFFEGVNSLALRDFKTGMG